MIKPAGGRADTLLGAGGHADTSVAMLIWSVNSFLFQAKLLWPPLAITAHLIGRMLPIVI